ncbi:exopolygalacturonase-like [Rosa sericea]
MGLSIFIQCACLVSLLVSLTLVHGQRRVFDVTNYGAPGDGRTDNSKALINAWNGACQNIGGGMVLFPRGTFVVAPVVLPGPCKGPMELEIQGTIQASKDVKDFIDIDHWITIQYVHRLRISGGGTLDGLGADGWGYNDCQKNPGRCKQLPATLRLDFVTKGYINHITSINSKNTHINLFACKDVLIRNVKISAPGDSPNTDGIHIGNSQNIYIVDSHISTGDDCVSVLPGSQYINVTGVQCGPGHGISIGSLGKGAGDSVNDMYVTHCRFVSTQNGVRIKTWAVDSKPGTVSRVAFEDLEMVNVDNPIIIDQEYCPGGGCNTQESSEVQISDVKFNDIRGTSATKDAVTLKCSRSKPCQNIELKDIDLTFRGPGGPAVSLCYNVKGRAYGLQKPLSHLNTPRVAAYNEIEYDNLEGRAYGLQNPSWNLNTVQVSPHREIEDPI